MPLRLRSAGGGSVRLSSPVALATDVSMEVPAYDGAKVLTDKTPGTVLQVVSVNKTDTFVGTSVQTGNGYFVDVSGLAATITPKSATSKILVQLHMYIGLTTTSGGYQQNVRVRRNGSYPIVGDSVGSRPRVSARVNLYGLSTHGMHVVSGAWLDSPNSIAVQTYQIELGGYSSSTVVYVNRSEAFQGLANDYDGVPVSSLTLMEIAA